MKDFPWWVLLLNGILLIPVLLCPLFLFGGLYVFRSENTALQAVNYVLVQLVWMLPVILGFKSLDLYRRGWTVKSISLSVITLVLTILYLYFLLA